MNESEIPAPTRFLVDIKPASRELGIGLDLAGYEVGGAVEACPQGTKNCVALREKAREFIVDHWNSKTKAYIAVDFPCADCGPTDHIFIQPNDRGEWQIIIVSTGDREGWVHSNIANNVEYKIADELEKRRESSNRVLSFLDKNRKEIDSF